uniref:Phospholipid/glycerol acyltransferase domain-containing protein n=1 Tax=Chromera velia CCMP2878 TaxID=1169474 RepID=A0A0G4IBZ0_9ALVE|eukprot:Cvel_12966.t1-p1 / transcript=Cvel_12966.t1 / gene=Cvel_12966 / organism=Chromera_velia_CCMP2878 / gene_product=Transmembrane protein 68, putative / transcript_product=Transmembrane protein 68, putative / location=Cvel_scaffold868:18823-22480(-) / protein_length=784 / sequence_SO=supercontig / SO=protein_coding / is_pseudo=false
MTDEGWYPLCLCVLAVVLRFVFTFSFIECAVGIVLYLLPLDVFFKKTILKTLSSSKIIPNAIRAQLVLCASLILFLALLWGLTEAGIVSVETLRQVVGLGRLQKAYGGKELEGSLETAVTLERAENLLLFGGLDFLLLSLLNTFIWLLSTNLEALLAIEKNAIAKDILSFSPESFQLLRPIVKPYSWFLAPKFFGTERLRKVAEADTPMIIVCNHALLALEVPLLLEGVWQHSGKRTFLRTLGDHVHFQLPLHRQMVKLMGVVHGSRDNCRLLLRNGHSLLIYPGGGDEVMRPRKHGKYSLLWKNRVGFAKMAIEHGVPIVPAATVGTEEMLNIVSDIPIGAMIGRGSLYIPLLRPCGLGQLQRVYFWFGDPIPTSEYQEKLKEIPEEERNEVLQKMAEEVRDKAKHAVKAGIRWLLQVQAADEDRRLLSRLNRGVRSLLSRLGLATPPRDGMRRQGSDEGVSSSSSSSSGSPSSSSARFLSQEGETGRSFADSPTGSLPSPSFAVVSCGHCGLCAPLMMSPGGEAGKGLEGMSASVRLSPAVSGDKLTFSFEPSPNQPGGTGLGFGSLTDSDGPTGREEQTEDTKGGVPTLSLSVSPAQEDVSGPSLRVRPSAVAASAQKERERERAGSGGGLSAAATVPSPAEKDKDKLEAHNLAPFSTEGPQASASSSNLSPPISLRSVVNAEKEGGGQGVGGSGVVSGSSLTVPVASPGGFGSLGGLCPRCGSSSSLSVSRDLLDSFGRSPVSLFDVKMLPQSGESQTGGGGKEGKKEEKKSESRNTGQQ